MRTCLLCGKPADSLEHHIPQWLSEATGQGAAPIMIGTAAAGVIVDQSSRGCAKAAKHRNLCTKCNNQLGSVVEGKVRPLLAPFVAPNPITDWIPQLNDWLPRERALVAWWAILRAVQLNEQFRTPRIPINERGSWVTYLLKLKDGEVPPLPKGVHVELASASGCDWGFSLTRQLYDRSRGMVVQRDGSFLWSMQANKCLLVAASIPDAHLLKDQGWGYGLVPHDPQKCPTYDHMRGMLERSHIDTRRPRIYSVTIGRRYRL